MDSQRSSYPVFIIEMDTRKIRKANETAIAGFDNYNPIGKDLDQVIYIEKDIGNAISPAYFNGRWYNLHQETLIWEGMPHIKVSLQDRPDIPDFDTLSALKNMIGFLLHRMRSPLTGMQGYANLIELNVDDKTNTEYLERIKKSIEILFNLLDELETLQNISLKEVESNNYSASAETIIKDIISEYPPEIQETLTFIPPADHQMMRCNPADLKRILSELIGNAVVHAPSHKGNKIIIDLPSSNAVKVSHNGNPIPRTIARQLFFPFVTGKASRLGIGLTKAMLFAKRYKGSIFLTSNSPFHGVSFTFCLPPLAPTRSEPLF